MEQITNMANLNFYRSASITFTVVFYICLTLNVIKDQCKHNVNQRNSTK